ncbi:MAG: hypothetical protein KatS3mg013_0250 [Actinomycetota bacterium]|nr:MAG: hypothetical protein KatS3mg013_0250 [Actinomycetota bacterium]
MSRAVLVALARIDLRIPGVRSLKEKRRVVRTLTAALRSRFPVSVAEVDHQDLWQRATIGVALVGGEGHHLRRVLHEVQRTVERWAEVEVLSVEVDLLAPES